MHDTNHRAGQRWDRSAPHSTRIQNTLFMGCLLTMTAGGTYWNQAAANSTPYEGPTTSVIVVDHARLTSDTLSTHDRATTGDLIMEFSNMRSDDGVVRFGLFANDKGWPAEWTTHSVAWGKATIKDGKAVVLIRNLPRGQYGMNGYHDENNNNQLDSNFLGIPREGYCFSTNYRPRLSAPRFRDVNFTFLPDPDTGTMAIPIEMQYR